MQLLTILLLAVTALISAAPLSKRDAATVLSDISTISNDVLTLTSLVNSYNGTSTAIVSKFKCLESSLQTASSDTTSSSPFTETESESISNAISALTSNVITLLQDLDAKVDVVKAAGDTNIVESALTTLQSDTNDFLTAITDQVTESETDAIDTSADEINYAFNQALATY